MFRTCLLAIPFVAAASVASAQSYVADNRLAVQPVASGGFAVPTNGRFGARGAWCAAADYAKEALGKSGTTRIYVQQPLASGGRSVVFGLDPAGASPSSVSSTSAALRVGDPVLLGRAADQQPLKAHN